jgi:hypothetical protein
MADMDDRISKIKIGSYVKLKEGFDQTDFYRGVSAGATGWVRKSKIDEYGFPMILIEWDEFNVKWSGERDKWSFESHFSVLNDGDLDLNQNEKYIADLREASDDALASDGFVLISIKKTKGHGVHGYVASVYGSDLDPSAKTAIEREMLIIAECIKADQEYADHPEGDDFDESGW